MLAMLGQSAAQRSLTVAFFALACFALFLHEATGNPTPLFITVALMLGYVVDLVLTVKAVFVKENTVRVVAGVVTKRTTYYTVIALAFAFRQLAA